MQHTETESGGQAGGRQWLVIAALAVYTGLLLLGTIGELVDIGWILNIPIFRGP